MSTGKLGAFGSWFHRPLPRLPFLGIGVLLFAIKVGVDAGIAHFYGRAYSVLFYVSPVDAPLFHSRHDSPYWQALAIAVMPFALAGVALTVRRLNDAALPPSFVLFFFVPFANLLFFLMMAIVPSRPRRLSVEMPKDIAYREAGAPPPQPPLPPMRRYPRLLAAAFGTISMLGTLAISVGLLKDYGVALMLGAPIIAGFTTGASFARLAPGSRFQDAAIATALVLALTITATLVFAGEGLGCLCMFVPLMCIPTFLGSLLGFATASAIPARQIDATIVGASLLFFALLGLEHVSPLPPLTLPPVETSVEIDAPPAKVWSLLPAMADMPAPEDWVFRYAGIAYPVRATLDGQGLGAKRTCDFNTGPALETVDVWSPGHVLGFRIDSQPDPMTELTLYHTVRQPHLDGYVRNLRGELAVEELPGGRTRLTGRSWYQVSITPETYWRLWSDFFIHKIHQRVLGVVKARAEAPSPGLLASGG